MSALHVFSGANYDFGEVGIATGAEDAFGKPLATGDIVLLGHRQYVGTDAETLTYDNVLSVVVTAQEDGKPFVMGIKDCGFTSPEWQVLLVKKFSDVVVGEHWTDWGFNYRSVEA